MLLFASLSLNVSAASDNLVESDITQWDRLDIGHSVSLYGKGGIYRLGASGGDTVGTSKYFMGIVYDLPSFVAGHSYSISFKLPHSNEIAAAFGVSFTQEQLLNYYNNSELTIGYGFVSSDGSNITNTVELFKFDRSNIASYVGTPLNTTFVASSASGRPCIYIQLNNTDASLHFFYITNICLVDNDDNSKELTGIKGFLHSIRWDLVGGYCEEDDCPHREGSNSPHLSLTDRMTAGFASLLENIGSKFEEGSTLNVWFNNLSSGVSSLGDRISSFFNSLGDRISGFFNSLGDRISGFFDKLKEGMSSGFSDVGSWFSNLGENLSDWFDGVKQKFQEIGDSIKQKFQDIADKFTEFFEKFKPRVSINLEWVRGVINAQGTVFVYPNAPEYKYVIISEALVIPSGNNYKLDYIDSDETNALIIFKYDLEGNFLEMTSNYHSFEGYVLEGGYQYRFRSSYTPGVEDLSIMNDYVIVYADEGWINALLLNLKNGIKSLFVPDEAALLKLKTDLDTSLSDHLGIIYSSSTLISDFLQTVTDIVANASDDYSLVVPEVTLNLSGTNYTLWNDTSIDFSFMENAVISTIYDIYTVCLYIFFGFLELKYALRVYKKVIAN